MKKVFGLVVIIILLLLALPISNLVVGLPANTLNQLQSDDPLLKDAAAILGNKCVNCHTDEYKLPFYAKLPPATQIITYDIDLGTQYIDYKEALQSEGPVDEVVLAKTEYVLDQGTMPPMRYLALHWDGSLTAAEKKTLHTWIAAGRSHFASATVPEKLKDKVIRPIPDKVDENAQKVALGDKLFHDKRLSKDDTLSCASCHGLDKGGTDQEQFATGVEDQVGDINSPTVYNSGYQFKHFWDGRAATLEEQADGPVNNPIEMASNWEEVTEKLQADEAMTQAFMAIYPDGYKMENFVDAIATFERTLITPNAPFDKFLKGDESALSEQQQQGYKVFSHGCQTCHVGEAMGGQSFELMGRKADYFEDRGNISKPDYGRFNVTGEEADRFRIKVPTLRNIALTFPYLHDGSTSDLKEVGQIMAKYQTGLPLSDTDADALAEFMKALTGEYKGKAL